MFDAQRLPKVVWSNDGWSRFVGPAVGQSGRDRLSGSRSAGLRQSGGDEATPKAKLGPLLPNCPP